MAEPANLSAIQRMTRRAHATPAPDRGTRAKRAFQRAVRRAGAPFPGLSPEPQKEEVNWGLPLGDLLTELPDGGLLIGLDAPQNGRGLCLLQQPLVDALIEVQTTGRVDRVQGPGRPVTKIDIALTRDFVELLLSAFAAELDGVSGVDWPRRLSFGGVLSDRRQLPLLMPDVGYHRFGADVALGEGAKSGSLLLAVPAAADGAMTSEAAASANPDPAWQAAFRRAVGQAEVPVGVILTRVRRNFAELEALAPGDLIGFDAAALTKVGLEDTAGQTIFRGRLGQQHGRRAMLMTTGPAPVPKAQPVNEPPVTPRPPEATPPSAPLPDIAEPESDKAD